MKKPIQNKLLTICGIFLFSLLFACSSEPDRSSGFNQQQAIITADNIQYFVDHISLGGNTSIAKEIILLAEPMINQLLTNGTTTAEITLNCGGNGSITGVPAINNEGVGTLGLTLQACQPQVTKVINVGSSAAAKSITLSGSTSLQIFDFEIYSEGEVINQETGEVIADGTFGNIKDAALSFNNLLVESEARVAQLNGSATIKSTDKAATDFIQLENKRTSEYKITGENQQFSRKFRLDNFSVVTGVSIQSLQVLPLAIGIVEFFTIPTGTVIDELEGSVELVAEKFRQVINQEDGNVIGIEPILELIGAEGSRAVFLSYHDNTATIEIDENGDGDFESRVTLPW